MTDTPRFADLSDLVPISDVVRQRVERHPNQIVRVELHDEQGVARNPYILREAENRFFSYAVFSDGSRDLYPCHWRCFPRGGRDGTVVFGNARRKSVVVHRHAKHEEYMELSCWAKDPASGELDIPFAGVGFRYSERDD